jgi:nucleoside-diphosphate-sugar epimerase
MDLKFLHQEGGSAMTEVLVAGATGFVGSNLVKACKEQGGFL